MKILSILMLVIGFQAQAAETTKAVAAKTGTKKVAKKESAVQTLQLDTATSKAVWLGKKVTGEHSGTVNFKEGSFEYKGGEMKSGTIVVDLMSLADTDLKDPEYKTKLETHLKSEDFFNAEKFPTATFKIKSFNEVHNFAPGEPNAIVKGDLTIRGVTKPQEVKLFYTPTDSGFQAKGKMEIDRTQFGLKYNSKKFFSVAKLGDKLINDLFQIDLDISAKK